MNPRAVHIALVLGGVAAAAYLVAMLILAGCRATMPPEPPYVETITAAKEQAHDD